MSDEAFTAVFQDSEVPTLLLVQDGRFLRANTALCDLLGYTEPEFMKLTFMELTHSSDHSPSYGLFRTMLAGEIAQFHMIKKYVHKAGHPITCLLSTSLTYDKKKDAVYFLSQIQELDRLQRREDQAWPPGNEHVQQAFSCSPIPTALLDSDGVIIYANYALSTFCGCDTDILVNRKLGDLLATGGATALHEHIAALVQGSFKSRRWAVQFRSPQGFSKAANALMSLLSVPSSQAHPSETRRLVLHLQDHSSLTHSM